MSHDTEQSTPHSCCFQSCLLGAVCSQSINVSVFMRNVASTMKLSMKSQLFNIQASASISGHPCRLFRKQNRWQRLCTGYLQNIQGSDARQTAGLIQNIMKP